MVEKVVDEIFFFFLENKAGKPVSTPVVQRFSPSIQ